MKFLALILFKTLAVSLILNDATKADDTICTNSKHLNFTQSKEEACDYKIEDKIVSESEYSQFCESLSLVEIEGTYVCKKMSGGGHYWYDAKAKDGNVYVVGGKVDEKYCLDYIHRKK